MATNTCNAVKREDTINALVHKHDGLVANIIEIHTNLAGIKDTLADLKGLKQSMEQLLHKHTHEHMSELPNDETSQHGENRPSHSL